MNYESEFLKALTMTNKEAAEILKGMQYFMQTGRGTGKTISAFRHNIAFEKAIKCLEEHSNDETEQKELDFCDLMERLNISTSGTRQRGLRADMKYLDEFAGIDIDADIVGGTVSFSPGTLDPSCYGKYDRVLMQRQLFQEEAYQTFMKLSGLDDLIQKQTDGINKVFITTHPIPDGNNGYYGKFKLDGALKLAELPWEKNPYETLEPLKKKQRSDQTAAIAYAYAMMPQVIAIGLSEDIKVGLNNEWNYISKMGPPSKSGHYEVLINNGMNEDHIEEDDYTNIQKIWWNSSPIAWREIR